MRQSVIATSAVKVLHIRVGTQCNNSSRLHIVATQCNKRSRLHILATQCNKRSRLHIVATQCNKSARLHTEFPQDSTSKVCCYCANFPKFFVTCGNPDIATCCYGNKMKLMSYNTPLPTLSRYHASTMCVSSQGKPFSNLARTVLWRAYLGKSPGYFSLKTTVGYCLPTICKKHLIHYQKKDSIIITLSQSNSISLWQLFCSYKGLVG